MSRRVLNSRESCATNIGFLCLVILSVIAPPRSAAGETTGPEKGILVLVGGGDPEHSVFNQFIELAGGNDAKLVVIPTASSSSPEFDYAADRTVRFARESLGMPNVTVVHSHDRSEANSEDFVRPIRMADAIWFGGGRQWRIADAYLGTLTEQTLRGVLERGGVIGGTSAGATIQGSFLVRGDTSGSNVLIGDHQIGFGYIKNAAIDQHVIPRRRQQGLIEVLTDPEHKIDPTIERLALLGIGIDEGTGIVVRQNEFEVVGKADGVVLIYDPQNWESDGAKYQTLARGTKYNMKDRRVIFNGPSGRPKDAAIDEREAN